MSSERPAASSDYLEDPADEAISWGRLQHYLYAPLRRPLMVLVPWAAIIALSFAALFVLPKRYRSTTLILIESEKVPESFVAKVATQDRVRSLDTIRSEILSRTRLEAVMLETRPFSEIPSKTRAVEAMQRATSVNRSGSDGFTIEFVHGDPRKAHEVADRLATLFIEETEKAREQQVEGAVDFLVAQVAESRGELLEKEEAMRRYKEARMGRLPEQLQTNLATMGMLQQELRSVEETLLFARERQEALARGLTRAASGVPGEEQRGEPVDELTRLHSELAELRARYTDEHPDVTSVRARIARLEARRSRATSAAAAGGVGSPEELTREQLERAGLEVKKLEDRRADLTRRVAELRGRIEETPRTEQALANLQRDYDKLDENYKALLGKQLEAQMAGRLEQRWKGERFRVLDPANLPERPEFPKPVPILVLGALLGMCAGVGAALVAEYLDPTIKDTEDLQSVLDFPILARIPHVAALRGPAPR